MITILAAAAKKPYMRIDEFVKDGYMQEVNRCVLHPLGLTLVARVGDEDMELSVIDARQEPGGIVYDADGPLSTADRRAMAEAIADLWTDRGNTRLDECGFLVQPVDLL